MAVEKFIRGKHDDCKHEGLYSIRKREQAAQYELDTWYVEMQEGIEYTLPITMKNSKGELVRNKSPWQQPQTQPKKGL